MRYTTSQKHTYIILTPIKQHLYIVKLGFTEAVLTSTHNLCFEEKYETYQNFYLKIFIFGGKIFSIFEYDKHVFAMFLTKRMAFHVNHFLSYDDD